MSSSGPAVEAARREIRELIDAKGHAVDNAREMIRRIEAALDAGTLALTPKLETYLMDLRNALDQEAGEKLGGKSAEAARFIMRAIGRELDNA